MSIQSNYSEINFQKKRYGENIESPFPKRRKTETTCNDIFQKKKDEFKSAEIPIYRIEETQNIPTLTISELLETLKVNTELNSLERYLNFSNKFKFISKTKQEPEYYRLLVKIPEGYFQKKQKPLWLDFTLETSEYDSQCFAEKELRLSNRTFHFINARLAGKDDLCFQIRLDSTMSSSEILHIQKTQDISGTQMKSLCMAIVNYVGPTYVYLYDDSKIKTESQIEINLRVLLPIVNPNPKTWYTSDGFQLLEFDELQLHDSDEYLPEQNHTNYNQAIEYIRNTKLPLLTTDEKISKWTEQYPQNQMESEHTVCQLGYSIYEFSKKGQQAGTSTDLSEFYSTFLTPNETFPPEYNDALTILYDYKVWYKDFQV